MREPKDETSSDPEAPAPERLASRPTAGSAIGGILAGLEATVTGRPQPPARIEETYRDAWASLDGVTVDGLDGEIERDEPPDRSGARL